MSSAINSFIISSKALCLPLECIGFEDIHKGATSLVIDPVRSARNSHRNRLPGLGKTLRHAPPRREPAHKRSFRLPPFAFQELSQDRLYPHLGANRRSTRPCPFPKFRRSEPPGRPFRRPPPGPHPPPETPPAAVCSRQRIHVISYVIPRAFIAAIMGSEKKIGSTRSTMSPDTSRKFRLFSKGTRARRAPLSIPTWSGSAGERNDLMFP